MIREQVSIDYLKCNHKNDCELTLDCFDSSVKHWLYSHGSNGIGYVSYADSGQIWSLEVFTEHRGNNYGRKILKDFISNSDNNEFKLTPVEDWLVDYYQSIGFEKTNEYEPITDFEIMEIKV